MRSLTMLLSIALATSPVLAGRLGPVTDEATKTECGACHMAYPAALLPARSWDALTSDLANHFGEDASLAPDVTLAIKTYLMENAADAGGKPGRMMRGLPAESTPLRISELPSFTREHGKFSDKTMKKIGVAGNCAACHQGAANGMFDDD